MVALQYPQRMDGLCSVILDLGRKALSVLAVSSADGRALQQGAGRRAREAPEKPCSILSGWTGFAASRPPKPPPKPPHLQYPQRMDGLCSMVMGQINYRVTQHLQYPQRMDGLCSSLPAGTNTIGNVLAVSSADGRALQRRRSG